MSTSPLAWLAAWGVITIVTGCRRERPEPETGAVDTTAATTRVGEKAEKVALTTSSDEARTLFTRGRDLAEQFRQVEGRQLLEQAVAKDPSFALAHYQLALTSSTPKAFLQHLNQAVTLADKASEGERLMILSVQAVVNADPKKATQYAEELVAKYPRDERAHFALGGRYSSQQQWDKAIGEYNKAIEINPSYSPAYNSLGYAYRPVQKYDEAEKAFKKYIELVPREPNPYDSYAELLMKTGRFEESIEQYRKALSMDPHFSNSFVAIAADLMFQDKHDQALAEANKLYDAARDDGDRRTALISRTVTYVDAGKTAQALQEMEKQYAIGAKSGDTAAMAEDAVRMGDILLESGRADQASERYQQSLDLVEKSSLSADQKEDARLAHHYDMGRVALKNRNLKTAKTEADTFMKGAETRQNDARVRQAHLLAGMIALQEKQLDQALSELGEADQQDPYVLYTTALVYQAKGDAAKAKEFAGRAANMNILPTLHYAFVRAKAKKIV